MCRSSEAQDCVVFRECRSVVVDEGAQDAGSEQREGGWGAGLV